MTCIYCRGIMENSTDVYVEQFGNAVIVVKNVPCIKCRQCGEAVFTASVMKQLDRIINNVKDNVAEDLVLNYSDIVA